MVVEKICVKIIAENFEVFENDIFYCKKKTQDKNKTKQNKQKKKLIIITVIIKNKNKKPDNSLIL